MLLFRLFSNFKVAKLLLCAAVLLFGASCGFSPMYDTKGDNAEISAKLAAVEVKPMDSLMGQEYRNALEDVLNPSNIGVAKEYLMEAKLNKTVLPLAIEKDRTVTRYKVIVIVDFSLKEISSGKTIYTGKVKNESDYDKVESDYATYVSEGETTKRAIREIAKDTKMKILSALLK